jgi:hypothetical protein
MHAIMKMAVFWVVAPRNLVEIYRRFRGACCRDRPYDGGIRHLWIVSKLLPDCEAQQPRIQPSSYSPPWEPQISRMLLCLAIQGVPFKTQPDNHVRRYKNKIWSRSTPGLIDSPNFPLDTRVKVIVVARPLLTTFAQKLCICKHGVFTSRTCVHSRALLRIEIVCCLP